jgi:hypothetical protein
MARQDHKADLALWLQAGYGDRVVQEFRFHPTRRWRFDHAIPSLFIGIEFDGIMSYSAHTSLTNILNDSDKINEAQILGWVVIRVNSKSLQNGTGYDAIERAVAVRSGRVA